ncbi:MAG TPA: hypothetical protein VLX09_18550 [Stellaceae bacterium]|nr:hypothetical protein [Stellaceae bacterium]
MVKKCLKPPPLKCGASAGDAASQVAALGLEPASPKSAVANVQRFKRELAVAYRAAGLKSAGLGTLWCVGGIPVTALTYAGASGGGTYAVAWGAVVFGAFQAVRGLLHRLLHSIPSATQEQLIQAFSLLRDRSPRGLRRRGDRVPGCGGACPTMRTAPSPG